MANLALYQGDCEVSHTRDVKNCGTSFSFHLALVIRKEELGIGTGQCSVRCSIMQSNGPDNC